MKYVVANGSNAYLAFDVAVEGTNPRSPDERVAIVNLAIGSTPETFVGQITLAYDAENGLYVGVSPNEPAPAEGMFVPSPASCGWMRIELIVERTPRGTDAGSGGAIEVYLEGSRFVRAGLRKVIASRDDLFILLGTVRALSGADARVIVDNVIVDVN